MNEKGTLTRDGLFSATLIALSSSAVSATRSSVGCLRRRPGEIQAWLGPEGWGILV